MGLFSRPYYVQYWNKETPDVRHSTLCDDANDLKRLVEINRKPGKDGKTWEMVVWELVPLDEDELEEVLAEVD